MDYKFIATGVTVLVFVLFVVWVTNWLAAKKVFLEEPKELTIEDKEAIKPTRYEEKKITTVRKVKDVNRWGRWKVTYKDGTQRTRVGMLHNVATAGNVRSYHEIK